MDNLKEMALRLKKPTSVFQTKHEKPSNEQRPRSRLEQRLNDRPIYYMIARRKRQKSLYSESSIQ